MSVWNGWSSRNDLGLRKSRSDNGGACNGGIVDGAVLSFVVADCGGSGGGFGCTRGCDCEGRCAEDFISACATFEIVEALVTTGLGAEILAGLLDLRLSTCEFLVAQLAVEGRADPSPLSLRLIASSRLP